MREAPWLAIGTGALNLALQLGGYQNQAIARLLWIVCGFALLQWFIRHELTRQTWNNSKVWVARVSRMTSFAAFIGCGAGIGAVAGLFLWLIIKAPIKAQTQDQPTIEEKKQTSENTESSKEKQEGNKKDRKKDDERKTTPKAAEKPSASQQPTFSVTNPSGSIINQGSKVDAPQTVNNYGPPEWRISDEDKKALREILSPYPSKVFVRAWQNDPIVAPYATDFNDILKDSGWQTAQIGVGGSLTLGGRPPSGIIIHVRGEPVRDGEKIIIPLDSPLGALGKAFEKLKIPVLLQHDKDQEDGLITVDFGPKPTS